GRGQRPRPDRSANVQIRLRGWLGGCDARRERARSPTRRKKQPVHNGRLLMGVNDMSTLLRRALSGVCALAAVGAAVPSASAADVVDGPQVHWNYSAWGKSRASSQIYDLFGEYMSERTGGKFTAQVHYGTLSKPRDN